MYINNNNNKRYHRNRETIDTSDTCIHDRSLYWSGTCTLIIIIIKDIIETEKQSIPLTHVYMTVHCTGSLYRNRELIPLTHVYMTVHCTGLVHVH